MNIPIEILNVIFNYSDCNTKLKLITINKKYYDENIVLSFKLECIHYNFDNINYVINKFCPFGFNQGLSIKEIRRRCVPYHTHWFWNIFYEDMNHKFFNCHNLDQFFYYKILNVQ